MIHRTHVCFSSSITPSGVCFATTPYVRQLLILLFLSLLSAAPALAQGNLDENLAAQFMADGEYGKAAGLYQKLLNNDPASLSYYDALLRALEAQNNFKEAEELARQQAKKYKSKPIYEVDRAYFLQKLGDDKEAVGLLDELLKDLTVSEDHVITLVGAYSRRNYTLYAIETYKKGRRLLGNDRLFREELTQLYMDVGKYPEIVREYITEIDKNLYAANDIKDKLGEVVTHQSGYDEARKELLRRVQAMPDQIVYSDLLNWLYMQRKEWRAAYTQAKALDKRTNAGGMRLVALADVLQNYGEFQLAEQAYREVLEYGVASHYYANATRGLLDMQYNRLVSATTYPTSAHVDSVIQAHKAYIAKYKNAQPTEAAGMQLRLAEVHAIYDSSLPTAINLLKDMIDNWRVDKRQLALAKLALADYLVLAEDEWEATLYYGQVEKMYKNEVLGSQAKFRAAKLSFYRGDFEWAKAQLDVLKGSTSELIANDALQLSLLIQDNLGLDTSKEALLLYAEADLLTFKNMIPRAKAKLDSLSYLFPNHSLADEVLLLRADIASRQHQYDSALYYFEQVYSLHAKDLLADDAVYRAATLLEDVLHRPEAAQELYSKLILEYPGSVYGVEARKRFRMLRGDVVEG